MNTPHDAAVTADMSTGPTPAAATTKVSVTVIGLGNLGRALARTFLDNGHPTTVWNRSAAKADPLVADGARRAATVTEAVAAGELVIVCVLDYDAVRQLLDPAAEALRGRVLVNLTSGTPGPARELAARVAGLGAAYLDGAVYAVPQTIGTREAFVLYSGAADAFEAHRQELGILGDAVFVGTDAGSTSLHDVALLSGMYGMFAGFFQALAIGDSAGIRPTELTTLLVRWLHEAAAALPGFAQEIETGDYTTETSNLEINAVGLANILIATRAQGVPVDLLTPLQELFAEQIAQGHGRAGMSRTIESLRHRRTDG
ncbi:MULTISPECIES: NAD(P)-dependent oxidoreductase [Streptomyces]|uniref:NAD(P)-dependent oxidoreductase n=1 Tax=Streptomyces mutomycini TaxID=284036 RepID=A0ABW0B641_9ACTN|nr:MULTISPECIES: NAD(P)-binding domain-containing protein [Streptomyces]